MYSLVIDYHKTKLVGTWGKFNRMDMYSDTTPPSQIKNHGSRIEDCHSKLDILLTYPVMLV